MAGMCRMCVHGGFFLRISFLGGIRWSGYKSLSAMLSVGHNNYSVSFVRNSRNDIFLEVSVRIARIFIYFDFFFIIIIFFTDWK